MTFIPVKLNLVRTNAITIDAIIHLTVNFGSQSIDISLELKNAINKNKIKKVDKVDIAAPVIPIIGTKMKFNTILITAEIK